MASGDTLAVLYAEHNKPPSSTAAQFTEDNEHIFLAFDSGTDERAVFNFFMPRQYAGGGITVTLLWRAATATSGNTIWTAEIERQQVGATDLDGDNFAAANTSAASAADTTVGELSSIAITFTDGADMDSLAAGESARIRIIRDADNGSDTMSGDAWFLLAEIQET